MDYIEVCKENMALQQENKQLKEQLAIRDKALELACKQLTYGEYYVKMFMEDYIEQAKESMK